MAAKSTAQVARAMLSGLLILIALIFVGSFWLSFTSHADVTIHRGVMPWRTGAWLLVCGGVIVAATGAGIAVDVRDRAALLPPRVLPSSGASVSVLEIKVPDVAVVFGFSKAPRGCDVSELRDAGILL